MHHYDIVVVGAGAAGTMAAIRAGQLGKKVVLVEKNPSLGKKILLTGKGRCNITNSAPIEDFIEKFGKQGLFLRSAFFRFFNRDLINFFSLNGLELKTERQGRVFPVTDKAFSVQETLKKCLLKNNVKVIYNTTLIAIERKDRVFKLDLKSDNKIRAKKVILATGGSSFRITGSTGDGFRIAQKLGHTLTQLKPALVPLKVKEQWVKELQGLSLKNIRVILKCGKKKITSSIGEVIFTHFGVSGPLILDLSGRIVGLLDEFKEIGLSIDLKPGLTPEKLKARLIREFKANGNTSLKNIMKSFLPGRLTDVFLGISGADAAKKGNQVTKKERHVLLNLLKSFPLTITGSLPIEEAMVTAGGVSTKEINPRTMESKLVPGLYFAGEIIEGAAQSGGYNLQQAFSTGFLAGESA